VLIPGASTKNSKAFDYNWILALAARPGRQIPGRTNAS
jgi:hypothetical protein